MLPKKTRLDCSVVVPVYNSEHSLIELNERLVATLEKSERTYEIIYVNDGSLDDSWNLLRRVKKSNPEKITIINLMKNFGQHKALLCGFNFSSGDYICTIDDDLQVPPEEIPKLFETAEKENADLVYGIYKEKRHSRIKRWGSRLIELIFQNFASTPGKGSSFKLIRRDIINKLKDFHSKYIYIDELVSWHAGNISFVLVDHNERLHGKSNYSFWNLIRLAGRIIFNYTTMPLRFITITGFLFALSFFFVGCYYIWRKFYVGAEIGFTSIIVTIFFSTGLILFSLGIIGEYLNRLFTMQSKKPNYLIKEIR